MNLPVIIHEDEFRHFFSRKNSLQMVKKNEIGILNSEINTLLLTHFDWAFCRLMQVNVDNNE